MGSEAMPSIEPDIGCDLGFIAIGITASAYLHLEDLSREVFASSEASHTAIASEGGWTPVHLCFRGVRLSLRHIPANLDQNLFQRANMKPNLDRRD